MRSRARCSTATPSRRTGSKRHLFTASTAAMSNTEAGCEPVDADVVDRALRGDGELEVHPARDVVGLRLARIGRLDGADALERARADHLRALLQRVACGHEVRVDRRRLARRQADALGLADPAQRRGKSPRPIASRASVSIARPSGWRSEATVGFAGSLCSSVVK